MNKLNSALENHSLTLSLPNGWEIEDTFTDSVQLFESHIYLAGIEAKNSISQKAVHGSAADFSTSDATLRAYYELIERISVLQFYSKCIDSGNALMRPSLSNGIAVHTDLVKAKQNAAMELLERDAVLSHWFEGKAPLLVLENKNEAYEFKTKVAGLSTWMTLLEKKDAPPGFPSLWLGYGTHLNKQHAIHKSKLEALQSAGFTHDIELPNQLPEAAGPDLHLDFLLSNIGKDTIQRWLNSPHYRTPEFQIEYSEIEYEINRIHLGSELTYSVKARHPKLKDLFFGVPSEFRGELCSYQLLLQNHSHYSDYRSLPHPIA